MASSDSRVSSEHEEDQAPARLSALYQYHNAPEVAPAHGLEYDDTVYPVSDKFPVVKETKFGHGHYTGKHAYVNDNKPPRIIFGMKIKTFLIVATVMVLVIVGAAVGGAVGGKNLQTGSPSPGTYGDMSGTNPSSSAATSPTATTTTATTYAAATPTYTPLTGCPATADNTTYTSQYAEALDFKMYCNLESPFDAQSTAQAFASSYVYSFADCAELCAGLVSNTNVSCTFAVYKPASPRPANCWTGRASNLDAASLKNDDGTEVAIRISP